MRCREQTGFALIEVMVSSMLVAIIAVGVLAGLDAAGSTSGSNKARSVASSLAQDDQERLRSMQGDDLAASRVQTNTMTVAGVPYTVKSLIRPVNEGGSGCGDGTLLKITSLVTWPKMKGVPTVRADSLMAPKPGSFGTGEGGLIAEIHNRSGGPLAGVSVSIAGAKSDTDITDENGCASFLYIPSGNYTLSFSSPGYVNAAGTTSVSKVVGVPDGAVSTNSFDYDRAGKITGNFVTVVGGTTVPDESTRLAVSHSSLAAPGGRFFSASPAKTPIVSSVTVFPFTSAYSVFAGTCVAANPSNFGQPVATATLSAGGAATVTVTEPALNVTVTDPTGAVLPGALVKTTGKTCSGSLTFTTDATGKLPKPGVPYGDYDVCAQALVNGELTPRRVTKLAVQNRVAAGSTPFTLQILGTSTQGACP